jgi:hypothetical protein
LPRASCRTAKGIALIQKWIGIRFESGVVRERMELRAVLERTRFGRDEIPNRNSGKDLTALRRLIGPAVDVMTEEMREARRLFTESVRPELNRQLERLSAFRDARNAQLELQFDKMAHVREERRRAVASLYEQYQKWIRDTLETEDQPSIRIAAIFTNVS